MKTDGVEKKIKTFQDLVAWQKAHKLTLMIYSATEKFPQSERFITVTQLRRASVSIESCIAEGFSRYHYKDRMRFYYDARGSIAEVQSQLITAKDLRFLTTGFDELFDQTQSVGRVLGGLIKSTSLKIP